MRRLFNLIVIGLMLTSCGRESNGQRVSPDPKSAVEVIKKDLHVERGGFILNKIVEVPSHGLTEWMFHCYPQFSYDKKTSLGLMKSKVIVVITKVSLTISCPIQIRLANNADKQMIAHEDGHLQIIKDVYAHADESARQACEQTVGKEFAGEGGTEEEAIGDALDKASKALCAVYTKKTVSVANAVSDNFDRITKHAMLDMKVSDALKQSWDQYALEHSVGAKQPH